MKISSLILFWLLAIPAFGNEGVSSRKAPLQKDLDKIFTTMLNNLLGVYSKNTGGSLNDSELCYESEINRLNFIVRDIPYTNLTKFKKKCFFEGSFRNEFNKKLSTDLKVKNIYDYNKLQFDYLITKKMESGMITLNTDITNGSFSGANNKKIKFTSVIRMTISLEEVLFSAGQNGINLDKATVDVLEYNGVVYKYHKNL
ncbi:MAG: hypothetical protein Q7U04_01935 [Bacteriovorax sp.]|nr:hypothetical protein [Bacteriovorax sp.]